MTGVILSSRINHLFGLAKDRTGWMLVMHESEGGWLANFPVGQVFVGFNDGLILMTEDVTIFDIPFKPIGLDLFIPHLHLRSELAESTLLGFGLLREATQEIERINRLVPIFTPERYEAMRVTKTGQRHGNLFSQQ